MSPLLDGRSEGMILGMANEEGMTKMHDLGFIQLLLVVLGTGFAFGNLTAACAVWLYKMEN